MNPQLAELFDNRHFIEFLPLPIFLLYFISCVPNKLLSLEYFGSESDLGGVQIKIAGKLYNRIYTL